MMVLCSVNQGDSENDCFENVFFCNLSASLLQLPIAQ